MLQFIGIKCVLDHKISSLVAMDNNKKEAHCSNGELDRNKSNPNKELDEDKNILKE